MGSNLPPTIMMMAVTARLLDLHQSRRQSGVYIPEVPESAGRNLGIALQIVGILRDIEMERGTGYVSLDELELQLSQRVEGVIREELEFVIASLAQEREIHYAVANRDCQFEYGQTRKTTSLVSFADSREQVKITENGRLFLRICEDEESWFYSDSDTRKLLTALSRNKFLDIPKLCHGIGQELAARGAMLADLIARPTRQEQTQLLVADGEGIGAMLANAKAIVREAMAIAFDDRTYDEFQKWQLSDGSTSGLELGNIQAELETLLRTVEAVARRFTEFLELAQQRRDVMVSEHHFLEMADRLVPACTPQSGQELEVFIAGILFPQVAVPLFHPSVITGEINIADLMDEEQVKPPVAFEMSGEDQGAANLRFRDFIARHREQLYERLAAGPLPLSIIIANYSFELLPDESALDFVGVYATPEALDGDNEAGPRVVVGLTGEEFSLETDTSLIVASDPIIFLAEDQ